MKLRKLFIFAMILCAAFTLQTTAQSKTKKPKPATAPRTVKDFYLLLPAKYFPYVEGVKNRRDIIGSSSTNKDLLLFDGNRPIQPVNAEILLLRRMSGVAMLAISYTNCVITDCEGTLRFVEYERGRWTEAAAAPPLERSTINNVFREKTGRVPGDKAYLIYEISAADKSISVRLYSAPDNVEIYKLAWDGNIYDFALPEE